jgi:hypothetical protein
MRPSLNHGCGNNGNGVEKLRGNGDEVNKGTSRLWATALVPLPGKVAVGENALTQGEHQLAELRELKCWGIEVLCI